MVFLSVVLMRYSWAQGTVPRVGWMLPKGCTGLVTGRDVRDARSYCSLYITDIFTGYDAIEAGMATITITFKLRHEIHQLLLSGLYTQETRADDVVD
jgi:hypothetical protein